MVYFCQFHGHEKQINITTPACRGKSNDPVELGSVGVYQCTAKRFYFILGRERPVDSINKLIERHDDAR